MDTPDSITVHTMDHNWEDDQAPTTQKQTKKLKQKKHNGIIGIYWPTLSLNKEPQKNNKDNYSNRKSTTKTEL